MCCLDVHSCNLFAFLSHLCSEKSNSSRRASAANRSRIAKHSAELVKEMSKVGAKVMKITGVKNNGSTVSVLAMGSNSLLVVLDGCARSLHDAVCVVRCLVKKWFVNFNRGSQ